MHHKECRCAVTDDHKCYNKQARFLSTLRSKPEYAKHIKTFKWTLVFYSESYRYDRFPLLPSYSKEKPSGVWDIFQTLTEVKSVKIAEWDSCGEFRKFMPKSLSLFPKATSFSSWGVLLDTFTSYIISDGRIPQLQHLHLEDFQLMKTGRDDIETTINFLDNLVGKCTALKSLTIIAPDDYLEDPESDRDTVWKAYLRLLQSVKASLEIFYFKSHPSTAGDVKWGYIYNPALYRDGFQRILDHGSWPRLRKVTILPPKQQPKKQK